MVVTRVIWRNICFLCLSRWRLTWNEEESRSFGRGVVCFVLECFSEDKFWLVREKRKWKDLGRTSRGFWWFSDSLEKLIELIGLRKETFDRINETDYENSINKKKRRLFSTLSYSWWRSDLIWKTSLGLERLDFFEEEKENDCFVEMMMKEGKDVGN